MVTHSSEITTLKAAYCLYIKEFPKKALFLRTTLFHYFLPYKGFGFDFHVEISKQLRGKQIEQCWELADQVKLEDLCEIDRVLTWQAEIFDALKASKGVRHPNKHYLKHFLEWCRDQGYTQPKKPEAWEVPQSLPGVSKAYHRHGGREQNLILNRQPLIEYGAPLKDLSTETKLELEELAAFWTDQDYEGNRPIPKPIEKSTYEGRAERMLYVIGWLALDKLDYHRQMCERAKRKKEKDPNYESGWLAVAPEPPKWLKEMQEKYPPRQLSRVRLEEFIPVVEIRTERLLVEESSWVEQESPNRLLAKIQEELAAQSASLSFETILQLSQAVHQNQAFAGEVRKLNQISGRAAAKDRAEALMQAACAQTRSLLKSFFKWLKYHHNPTGSSDGYRISPNYRASFCNSLMNLAKFRYRDMTKSCSNPDYSDILIVMELRNVRKEELNSDFKPNSVSSIKRDPTWRELGQLLKNLLVACAPRLTRDAAPEYRTMGPMRKQPSVAADFQKYLIMMFFRVIAPDRQHVVRELRQHDTLKLCRINWEARTYEEAPWDEAKKRYKAYYNFHTKLYYPDVEDVKDAKGNFVEKPQGKAFAWVVFLDASQTKIDQDNAYRIPKIYNTELEAWLNGREDYSGAWFNWPKGKGVRSNKWSKQQYHWCGYVDTNSGERAGFRDTFKPTHDFVFTQSNGTPFRESNMCRLYDAILWRYFRIRSSPHAVRSAATGHFKMKRMTAAENESLAKIKSHSVKMQDSSIYNKLYSLEKTAHASEMIVNDFLQEHGLDPEKYGLVERLPN